MTAHATRSQCETRHRQVSGSSRRTMSLNGEAGNVCDEEGGGQSHRISRAPPHSEAKQASVSPAHRPPKAWGLHSSSLFQTIQATHRLLSTTCCILSQATGVGDIHSFGIDRIHSFTYSPTLSRACTASPHSLYCLIPPTAAPRPPETPPHASVPNSIHRVHTLASTILTRFSASRQPNYHTSTSQ